MMMIIGQLMAIFQLIFTFNDNVVIEDDFTGLVDNIISLDIPALFKENYKKFSKR